MNWLYPNFLRRIDYYLKINYPHVWRTRVHDFGWFSLVLGNVVAFVFGMLIVGYNEIFSLKSLTTVNIGSKILFIFVFLFWVMYLLRFKTKSSDFKTRLTTWFMYALCVGLLGLNVATFFSSIAYRTAQLYTDEVVQADYDYLHINFRGKDKRYGRENYPFYRGVLREEHRTKDLSNIMARHGYPYTINDEIKEREVNIVYGRLIRLKAAKVYTQQPFFVKDNASHGEVMFYYRLLKVNWAHVIMILFFLPGLWFLLSVFRVRDVLISVFCTVLIFKGIGSFVQPIDSFPVIGYADPRLFACIFIVFILAIALSIKKYRIQNWKPIAGVLVLMFGVTFYMSLDSVYGMCSTDSLLPMIGLLMASLIAWLVSTRLIDRRNVIPFLR